MSEEGEGIEEHLTKKYGASAASSFNDPVSRLRVLGRKVGIEFNNERRMVDTKRAHALVEHLKNKGENESANKFMVDLYKSYFEDGDNINDETYLIEKVKPYGVDESECAFVLGDHNLAFIGKQARDIKNEYGVRGVPYFMIHPTTNGTNDKPETFSGAYPAEIIAEQLEEAASS